MFPFATTLVPKNPTAKAVGVCQSDREGECVLGKVTKVEFDEEQCDWFYTFEDGSICDEQSLLEEQTYKKN